MWKLSKTNYSKQDVVFDVAFVVVFNVKRKCLVKKIKWPKEINEKKNLIQKVFGWINALVIKKLWKNEGRNIFCQKTSTNLCRICKNLTCICIKQALIYSLSRPTLFYRV